MMYMKRLVDGWFIGDILDVVVLFLISLFFYFFFVNFKFFEGKEYDLFIIVFVKLF